jgi:NAD(P)-dependent dehydrogenase (short-subunit alcohol dehydrogenase family)
VLLDVDIQMIAVRPIVNISSVTVVGIAQRTAYASAKAAVNSFTRTWVLELAETGITVNAVAPGPVETALFRQNTPVGSAAAPPGREGSPAWESARRLRAGCAPGTADGTDSSCSTLAAPSPGMDRLRPARSLQMSPSGQSVT